MSKRKDNRANGTLKAGTTRMKKIDPLEPLKMEIAQELGLMPKIDQFGWDALSAQEAGRIGGLMTQRRRRHQQ